MVTVHGLRHPAAIAVAIVAFASAAMLWASFRPQYLNTDTAQYVVTARHFLRGEGLSTSLIYFEEQMAAGVVPAPQTVWPPGYPVLLAGAMAAGIPFTHAPFLVAMLSHFLASFLLYAIMRRLKCTPVVAAGGAAAYTGSILANVLVLRGLSESTYILFTLLSTWALCASVQSSRCRPWLVLCGAMAAAAFLMRYAGITFVASLGLMLAIRWLAAPSWRSWWDAVAAMIIPVFVVIALFWRNQQLVGSFTGGPTLEYGTPLSQVFRSLVWSFQQMIGVFDGYGRVWGIVIVAALLWVVFEFTRFLYSKSAESVRSKHFAPVFLLSAAYIVLTVLMYGYLVYQRLPETMSARYLLPLLPFLVIIVCVAISKSWNFLIGQPRRRTALCLSAAAALVALVIVQAHAAGLWQGWFRGDRKFSVMMQAMTESEGGITVREQITSRLSDGAILALDGQLLGMWLDVPAIGLTERAWTRKTWTTSEVYELVKKFNIRVVCAFPTVFEADAEINGHRQFFVDLARGTVPPWLTLISETPSASIYAVKTVQ